MATWKVSVKVARWSGDERDVIQIDVAPRGGSRDRRGKPSRKSQPRRKECESRDVTPVKPAEGGTPRRRGLGATLDGERGTSIAAPLFTDPDGLSSQSPD